MRRSPSDKFFVRMGAVVGLFVLFAISLAMKTVIDDERRPLVVGSVVRAKTELIAKDEKVLVVRGHQALIQSRRSECVLPRSLRSQILDIDRDGTVMVRLEKYDYETRSYFPPVGTCGSEAMVRVKLSDLERHRPQV